jgi:hypothetical protein
MRCATSIRPVVFVTAVAARYSSPFAPSLGNLISAGVDHPNVRRNRVEAIRIAAMIAFRLCPKTGVGIGRLYPHQMTVRAFIDAIKKVIWVVFVVSDDFLQPAWARRIFELPFQRDWPTKAERLQALVAGATWFRHKSHEPTLSPYRYERFSGFADDSVFVAKPKLYPSPDLGSVKPKAGPPLRRCVHRVLMLPPVRSMVAALRAMPANARR